MTLLVCKKNYGLLNFPENSNNHIRFANFFSENMILLLRFVLVFKTNKYKLLWKTNIKFFQFVIFLEKILTFFIILVSMDMPH